MSILEMTGNLQMSPVPVIKTAPLSFHHTISRSGRTAGGTSVVMDGRTRGQDHNLITEQPVSPAPSQTRHLAAAGCGPRRRSITLNSFIYGKQLCGGGAGKSIAAPRNSIIPLPHRCQSIRSLAGGKFAVGWRANLADEARNGVFGE